MKKLIETNTPLYAKRMVREINAASRAGKTVHASFDFGRRSLFEKVISGAAYKNDKIVFACKISGVLTKVSVGSERVAFFANDRELVASRKA